MKKILYCSAIIALGSAAATKKNGALVADFKNEQAPVLLEQVGGLFGDLLGRWRLGSLLQASQDVQEVQEVSDELIQNVVAPLVQNLDDLYALEKSGDAENDQDMEDLLNTLVNLRDNLEDLEGVESVVNDAGQEEPIALLENTQDAKTLTDLISKIVYPLIKNLDGLFGKQTTPVLLEKHNRAGALKQLADWIMGRKSAVLLENKNKFFWSKSKSGRYYKNQQASVLLEQAQGVQSLRDLLSKVINPLIDQLSQHLAQQATPALLENRFIGGIFDAVFGRRKQSPALLENNNEFYISRGRPGRRSKNQETPALVETEFHPRLRFGGRN